MIIIIIIIMIILYYVPCAIYLVCISSRIK